MFHLRESLSFKCTRSVRLKGIFVCIKPLSRNIRLFIQRSQYYSTDSVNKLYYENDNYQFMQQSKLPTMYFQQSLPRLPIPLISNTCDRFLKAVQPLLDKDEYEKTLKIVCKFQSKEGLILHDLLKEYDISNRNTSYISKSWFDMYLSDRKPLPLNYNPLLVMKQENRAKYQQQVVRAANLVVSSLRFWRSLISNQLVPEVYHVNPKKTDTSKFYQLMRIIPTFVATYAAYALKAYPLDMSQYTRLFGVTRIPNVNMDDLVQVHDSKHILVLRRGNMYAVPVLDKNGYIEAPNVILRRLESVIHLDNKRSAAEFPLGVLTALDRDEWARMRSYICYNKSNRQLLEQKVDAALFCLCLDSSEDPCYDDIDPIPLFKHLLAGDAVNRWFDKSVSLIVSVDGTAAINFEHSWGDGVAVLRYFNEIYKETIQKPFVSTDQLDSDISTDIGEVEILNFNIDDKTKNAIKLAKLKNKSAMDALCMHILRYPHLNKAICKKAGISPDSLMQLSFQLAYRHAFQTGYVGSYESCSTAAFRHGRTETIRPCTEVTKYFCESILSKKFNPDKDSLIMLQECSKMHGQLTKEAAMGQGFDRHLYALKDIAKKHGLNIPSIYNSAAYLKINHNIISTSTLSSNALLAGAFGPVVFDGFGIGYSIQNQDCGAIVTSYNKERGQYFIDSLKKSFEILHGVVNNDK